MKLLFKLYLLGQLIALPFMVGAIGSAFSGGTETAPNTHIAQTESAASIQRLSQQDLCDALNGPAINPVQDDLQQLKFITENLYGEEQSTDCFGATLD